MCIIKQTYSCQRVTQVRCLSLQKIVTSHLNSIENYISITLFIKCKARITYEDQAIQGVGGGWFLVSLIIPLFSENPFSSRQQRVAHYPYYCLHYVQHQSMSNFQGRLRIQIYLTYVLAFLNFLNSTSKTCEYILFIETLFRSLPRQYTGIS